MTGYAEVFQTIGAMVIFSLILLSATSMMQRNTYMQVVGELEQEVIAVAQDIIEEGRTKEFDENSKGAAPPANIPGDFTAPSNLGPEASDDEDGDNIVQRDEFNDFDDYHGWKEKVKTTNGEFNIEAFVHYVTAPPHDSTGVRQTYKKLKVQITSKFLNNNSKGLTLYNLDFIRNYYAD